MAVEIGINPITWTNDDMPELGGDIPLETCLAETRAAGYAGIELGGKFPRTVAQLRPILQQYRLKLVSGWYDGRICEREAEQEFAAVEPHLTPPKLQLLLRGGFHVWHFVGHGGFAKDGATGQLLFEVGLLTLLFSQNPFLFLLFLKLFILQARHFILQTGILDK